MSIVIDARAVGERLSGIERYVVGVLGGLAAIDPPEGVAVLASDPDRVGELVPDAGRLEITHCPIAGGIGRPQTGLLPFVRRLGGRLLHVPYLTAPPFGREPPVVVTVHDLIPQRHPDLLARSWKVRLAPMWRLWCRRQYHRAAAVITVSAFSRDELIEYAGLEPASVRAIHNGVRRTETDVDETTMRGRLELEGPLVTYVGRHDPYKNVDGLIHAFARLVRRTPEPPTLVVAGRFDSRYTPPLQRQAEDLGVAARVRFTDYLSEAERVALVRASSVFAFPSRLEGFGLPPLEAMAEGVPVVAARAGPLPEVLGDAALLVDPDDVEGLAAALHSALTDPETRRHLHEAGPARAAEFTWERSAAAHLEVYRSVII
jgi:alpha-1,3-rhamnosyl/mannosyltransferase